MLEMAEKKQMRISYLGQLCLILVFIEGFFIAARLCKFYADAWNAAFCHKIAVAVIAFGVVLLILVALWAYLSAREGLIKRFIRNIDIKSVGCVAIIMLFHFIVRYLMIGFFTYADGAIYYSNIYAYTLYLDAPIMHVIKNYRLGTHLSLGYNFWAFLSEMLVPGSGMGYQWLHLFMGVICSGCLFGIIRGFFPEKNRVVISLAALVISLQPCFFGTYTTCCLDYPIVVFFIISLYLYIKKKYLLFSFFLVCLGTTKETGLMNALVFAGSILLYRICKDFAKKGIKGVFSRENKKNIIIYSSIIVLLLAGFGVIINIPFWGNAKIIDFISIGNSKPGLWEDDIHGMAFRYNREHITKKLAQLYILNFSWIGVILLCISLIIIAIIGKKSERIDKKDALFIILLVYVINTLFALFYQEAKQPRYNMINDVLFLTICVIVALKAFSKKWINISTYAIIGVLLFVECFVTVDPLTRKVFTNVNTNGIPMVFTWEFAKNEPELLGRVGDTCAYNYQATYADRAFTEIINRVLREAKEQPQEIYMISSSPVHKEEHFSNGSIQWDVNMGLRLFEFSGNEMIEIKRTDAWKYAKLEKIPEYAVLFVYPAVLNNEMGAGSEVLKCYDAYGPYETHKGPMGYLKYYMLKKK